MKKIVAFFPLILLYVRYYNANIDLTICESWYQFEIRIISVYTLEVETWSAKISSSKDYDLTMLSVKSPPLDPVILVPPSARELSTFFPFVFEIAIARKGVAQNSKLYFKVVA